MIVLTKPHTTEKSMKLASFGEYTFLVSKKATKNMIAKIVAEKFKVDVISIKTINIKGEARSQRRVRKSYQTSGFKKAIVKIKKGQKISIFETPKEEVTVTTGEGEPTILREKKDLLRRTKVRVETGATGAAPTTQRKVITGK